MGVEDKERSVKDILRALQLCGTGLSVHRFAQARHVLMNAFNIYKEEPGNEGLAILLDEATRFALGELATAVWRKPCG